MAYDRRDYCFLVEFHTQTLRVERFQGHRFVEHARAFGWKYTSISRDGYPVCRRRVVCVEFFAKANSVIKTQCNLRRNFDMHNIPSRNTIWNGYGIKLS
jgi:hypothetical protein